MEQTAEHLFILFPQYRRGGLAGSQRRLVDLVCLVYLVYLVDRTEIQPDELEKPDRPGRPDRRTSARSASKEGTWPLPTVA